VDDGVLGTNEWRKMFGLDRATVIEAVEDETLHATALGVSFSEWTGCKRGS
jgi:hypothetical protein